MGANLPFLNFGDSLLVTQIALSKNLSCALFENGRVKCWGENTSGELGLGDTVHRGQDVAHGLPTLSFIDLGKAAVQKIFLSGQQGNPCASWLDGEVKCWGYGEHLFMGLSGLVGDQGTDMGRSLPFLAF